MRAIGTKIEYLDKVLEVVKVSNFKKDETYEGVCEGCYFDGRCSTPEDEDWECASGFGRDEVNIIFKEVKEK